MDKSQFTLLDLTFDWNETTYFVRALNELGEQPDRWDQPFNFLHGEMYGRIEVIEKPSDIEVDAIFCFWQDGHEICTNRKADPILFRKPGVYYFNHPAPGDGTDKEGNRHWIRCKGKRYFRGDDQLEVLQVQYRAYNRAGERKVMRARGKHWPKDQHEDMGPEVLPHLPIRQRIEILFVAKGEIFRPPPHWRENPAAR